MVLGYWQATGSTNYCSFPPAWLAAFGFWLLAILAFGFGLSVSCQIMSTASVTVTHTILLSPRLFSLFHSTLKKIQAKILLALALLFALCSHTRRSSYPLHSAFILVLSGSSRIGPFNSVFV